MTDDKLTADERAELTRMLEQRLTKPPKRCARPGCNHPIGSHGGTKGWVCRGVEGTGGCEVECTAWIEPTSEEPAVDPTAMELAAHREADRLVEEEAAARRALIVEEEAAERERERAAADDPAVEAPTPEAVERSIENGKLGVGPDREPEVEADETPAVVEAEEVSTDIEPVQTLPDLTAWQAIQGMAVELAKSSLVSSALRGKPADVQLILLTAHDLGITATQALAKINIIDGKPSMSAELMLALIQRAGHQIQPIETTRTRAALICRRMKRGLPEGPEATFEFTLDDAVAAGLCTIKDGKPYARDRHSKPLPWEKWTGDMLWARCVSRAGRRMFADVLAGVSYVPEELGYIEGVGFETPGAAASGPSVPDGWTAEDFADFEAAEGGRRKLQAMARALPEERKEPLRAEWAELARTGKLHPLTQLRESELDAAEALVRRYIEAPAGETGEAIEDAEIVGEGPGQEAAEPSAADEVAEPAPQPYTCVGCDRLIVPPNSAEKHAKGCMDAPF